MGWRERDYAKFTEEERQMLYDSSTQSPASTGPGSGAFRAGVGGVGLAVFASASLFLLGQLPRGHPIIPALHVGPPHLGHKAAVPPPVPARLRAPRVVRVGAGLTITGTVPPNLNGTVRLRGDWGSGQWRTFAMSTAANGSYSLAMRFNRRGVLKLRVRAAGQTLALGTIRVR
jgi:hypothetical protein